MLSAKNSHSHTIPHRIMTLDLMSNYMIHFGEQHGSSDSGWSVCVCVCVRGLSCVQDQCRLTIHCLEVFHVQGTGTAGAGRGCHRRKQVGRVRAAVARQQSHLVVVLSCGQTCVRGWRGGTFRSVKRKQEK